MELHFGAALKGYIKIVRVLLDTGADVNATDGAKKTPLHFAATKGHVDVAKVLIQNGADVNCVDKYKSTALHYAVLYGNVDTAKVLLQNGADVNAVQKTKRRRYIAVWYRRDECVKLLLQNGVDVHVSRKTEDGIALRSSLWACEHCESVDSERRGRECCWETKMDSTSLGSSPWTC